jgi:hypothetical protein
MRKSLTILLVVAVAALAGAQAENGGLLNPWKQDFLSCTCGLALLPVAVSGDSGGANETFFIPALDLRMLRGGNVTRRHGFWTGVELGAVLFFAPLDADRRSFSDLYADAGGSYAYTVTPDYSAAMAFLMAKCGTRVGMRLLAGRVDFGAEIGVGARMLHGYFMLMTDDQGPHSEATWSAPDEAVNVIIDGAVDAALLIGKNVRLFIRGGALLTPLIFDEPDRTDWWERPSDITGYVKSKLLLKRYGIDFLEIIPSLRLGFTVSYE